MPAASSFARTFTTTQEARLMDLIQCIYCSAPTKADFSPADLAAVLDQSRDNNAKSGVTGILLFHNRTFFQVLEGDRLVVEALFEKIEKDKRHRRVTKIAVEPIRQRAFADWSMGYPKISTQELETVPGLNDFFARGNSYLELGEGRAKALLGAFKDGQWRLSLS
jgi:hypothetical protein